MDEPMSSLRDRLMGKVKVSTVGCWEWLGAKQPSGYGQLWNGRRPEQAHRISYRLHFGEIAAPFEVDHICRNRSCVNPLHLRLLTHRDNVNCGNTIMGINARKTHCKRGHELTGNNVISVRNQRQCRACNNLRARDGKKRRKAARA